MGANLSQINAIDSHILCNNDAYNMINNRQDSYKLFRLRAIIHDLFHAIVRQIMHLTTFCVDSHPPNYRSKMCGAKDSLRHEDIFCDRSGHVPQNFQGDWVALADEQVRDGAVMKVGKMARTANRTTISLTESEIRALDQLKEHFDTPSISETIRRSISQSSLLKRYSDEEGDLVVERDGKHYVIPSRP